MNVVEYLKRRDAGFELIPHRKTICARDMSAVLHVPDQMVAKTVLLRADHGFRYLVAVLPADKAIDFERLSAVFGGACFELATEAELVQHCPDCEVGVLPPFGSQYGMMTIVDERLTADEEIVFEGNTHREAIRMRFDDFRRAEEPTIVSFTRELPPRKGRCLVG